MTGHDIAIMADNSDGEDSSPHRLACRPRFRTVATIETGALRPANKRSLQNALAQLDDRSRRIVKEAAGFKTTAGWPLRTSLLQNTASLPSASAGLGKKPCRNCVVSWPKEAEAVWNMRNKIPPNCFVRYLMPLSMRFCASCCTILSVHAVAIAEIKKQTCTRHCRISCFRQIQRNDIVD